MWRFWISRFGDLDRNLRLKRIKGLGFFFLLELFAAIGIVAFAVVLAVRAIQTNVVIDVPAFYEWQSRAGAMSGGGTGTVTVRDAPMSIAILDAILLLTITVLWFAVLRQVRGLFNEVDERRKLSGAIGYRLRRAGWFLVAAGGVWGVRDYWLSWWASDAIAHDEVADALSLTAGYNETAVWGPVVAGLILLMVSGFIRQVYSDDLYEDRPTDFELT